VRLSIYTGCSHFRLPTAKRKSKAWRSFPRSSLARPASLILPFYGKQEKGPPICCLGEILYGSNWVIDGQTELYNFIYADNELRIHNFIKQNTHSFLTRTFFYKNIESKICANFKSFFKINSRLRFWKEYNFTKLRTTKLLILHRRPKLTFRESEELN